MYKITLSDGRIIDNLSLNGTNYVSNVEVSESIFKNNLSHYSVDGPDGHFTFGPSELVQISKEDDGWYFILRELTPQENINHLFTKNQENANAAIRSVMNILAKFKLTGGNL